MTQKTRGMPVVRIPHVRCPRFPDFEKTTQKSVLWPLNGPTAARWSTSHATLFPGMRKKRPCITSPLSGRLDAARTLGRTIALAASTRAMVNHLRATCVTAPERTRNKLRLHFRALA
jgi:hypothetical protein